jgi:hypothetical protein
MFLHPTPPSNISNIEKHEFMYFTYNSHNPLAVSLFVI